jgi:16S rRNA (adenine1518-N6/adenine1519-N6)-dimethyltransferase
VTDGTPLGRSATARLLERHGVRPRKSLGQHFLVDPNIVRKTVAVAAVGPGDRVLEIGAGAGTLTRALAATGARVTAIEIDHRLRPVLEEALGGLEVDLHLADAAAVDLPLWLEDDSWVLVANLPYNVGTPLVLDLLRRAPSVERFVVMLQREAVERLAAEPGSRVYGLPSVVVRLHGTIRVAFTVAGSVFLPPPRVESAVAVVERTTAPSVATELAIELAATAFRQRRKMLRSSLRSAMDDPEGVLRAAGIDPKSRAEDVPPDGYLRLAEAIDAG